MELVKPEIRYPHVVWLLYAVSSNPAYQMGEAVVREGELDGFRFRVTRKEAMFTATRHFSSVEDARAVLDPQLKAWELSAALEHAPGVLEFEFRQPSVLDRPLAPGELRGTVMMIFGGKVTPSVQINSVPPPPPAFVMSPMVAALAELYKLSRRAPDTLLHAAYAMTTCVEHYTGGEAEAARLIGMSRTAFAKINELASTRGEGAQVRKFNPGAPPKPLSGREREWLERMLKLVVERAGAAAAGVSQFTEINLQTHQLS